MKTTTELKEFAQLAQASYALLNDTTVYADSGKFLTTKGLLQASPNGGFSEGEATDFTNRYKVLNQFRDPSPTSAGGFSATLFQDRDNPNRLILSCAGTEFETDKYRDLVTDAKIGLVGFAQPQAVPLYRYVKRLQTGAGQYVQYSDTEKLNLYALAGSPTIDYGQGLITGKSQYTLFCEQLALDVGVDTGQGQGVALMPSGKEVDLAGHSLGGHLAMLAQRLFPGTFDEVVTVNAVAFFAPPSATPGSANALDSEWHLQQFGSWDSSKITRIQSVGDGVSKIANYYPGTTLTVGMETQSDALAPFTTNHSNANVADGLALTELMGKLDARYMDDPRVAKPLFDVAANTPGASYETLLDGLRKVIQGNASPETTLDNTDAKQLSASRKSLYDNLKALADSPEFSALKGNATITLADSSLATAAKTDFAAFLSLNALSPIVMSTTDEAALDALKAANADLASAWTADKNARLKGDTTKVFDYSDNWYTDRTNMLTDITYRNKYDEANSFAAQRGRGSIAAGHYVDIATNTDITVGDTLLITQSDYLFGDDKANTLTGHSNQDHLFGGAGDDTLSGEKGDDYLEGNAGNDTLTGGAGKDTLIGNKGNDTYIVGDCQDTLQDDAAGLGSVRTKDGIVFAGGSKDKNATGVWKNGNIKYVQKGTNLVIIQNNDVANSTVIKEFDFVMAKTSSYVGIALRDDDGSGGGGSGGTGGTGGISGSVGSSFTDARNWVTPRDPLILDLDADGIELSPTRDAVLFDHNADGIKTGSQWAKADDGMLVRDLDGNGLIDSGRELFGDQTLLSTGSNAGKTAANGFEALSQLDSNADQVFDANDAAYAELKLWRDLNQDGISQVDELQSLSDAGITAISLDANTQGIGSFTQNGVQHTAQNVNLTSNNFYREFTDNPVVTAGAAALPQMQGSGLVRDLREAMSLGTPEALALQAKVSQFAAAGTSVEQRALLDGLLHDWAATSGRLVNSTGHYALVAQDGRMVTTDFGSTLGAIELTVTLHNSNGSLTTVDALGEHHSFSETELDVFRQLNQLEVFTGTKFIQHGLISNSGTADGITRLTADISASQIKLLGDAYDALRTSVYSALVTQTRLKPYMDSIGLAIDEQGVRLDFSALDAKLASNAQSDPTNAAVDLTELLHYAGDTFTGTDWDGAVQLAELLDAHELSAAQTEALSHIQYQKAEDTNSTLSSTLNGSSNADTLVGRSGDDVLAGAGGRDVLIGGAGSDQLFGGAGHDQLIGGAGSDTLNGQWGNDTYFWGAGQGNDTIADVYTEANGVNTVVLRGLNPQDISVGLVKEDDYSTVRLTITTTDETLSYQNSNYDDWADRDAPVNFVFADGTQWNIKDAIRQSLPLPTDGNDVLIGTKLDDLPSRLNGGAGDDLIIGREGADVIEGGPGNDTLLGLARKVTTDQNGSPVTPYWMPIPSFKDSDTYIFGRGDGQDSITDSDTSTNQDTLRFKDGVTAADLTLAQRGNDLVVQIKDSTDQITIKDFFWGNTRWSSYTYGSNAIECFEFADGTQWDMAQIVSTAWQGTVEDDVFEGDANGNVMSGGAGNDVLQGGEGDDVLDGGAGNDVLDAGLGADTIRFGRGDGQDLLKRDVEWGSYYSSKYAGDPVNPGGDNVLEFKAGVDPADVTVVRSGSTLSLTIKGTDDVLTVADFYIGADGVPVDQNFSLREIRFADGTVWGPQQMLAQTLIGDDGNNTITGFEADDVLDGQSGQDILDGDKGHNTYLFGYGDGADKVRYADDSALSTLAFKDGVSADDVMVRRVGNSAVFTLLSTGDSITFENVMPANYLNTVGVYGLDSVMFADGSSWTPEQIAQQAIIGTDGDDVISDVRTSTQTTLAGGAGDDTLIGSRGDTVYVFNLDYGHDTVDEAKFTSGTDVLRFGPGIVAADLVVTQQGADLVIGIANTEDQVTIKNHADDVIERVEVGGVSLSYQQVLGLVPDLGSENLYATAAGAVLNGSDKASLISGFAGADVLSGNGGTDTLDGGAGDDRLAGGVQRDRLIGGTGANAYVFNRGDDLDTIVLTPGASDVIELGEGIAPEDITVQMGSNDIWNGSQVVHEMVIGFGGNDAVLLQVPAGADFSSALQPQGCLRFADGSAWSFDDIMAQVDDGSVGFSWQEGDNLVVSGSQADDEMTVSGAHAYLDGRGNDDYLQANNAQALLVGGDGADRLNAQDGGSVLAGGHDADIIDVGTWLMDANTAVFNLGDGLDVVDSGSSPGVLSFGVGIDPADINFSLDANGDLVLAIAGSAADEVRTLWYEPDLETPYTNRAIYQLQFVDSEGKTRLFDLSELDASFDANALTGAGVAVLAQAPEMEIALPFAVYGGEAAIAYAQTGDLLGDATITANDDLSGDNTLFGSTDDDALDAETGQDVVYGNDGDDVLVGGDGDDYLYGGAGNDVLDAGTGHDLAYGGAGDDTYLYQRGDGYLYIADAQYNPNSEMGPPDEFNQLIFGDGISFDDLAFSQDGQNLLIQVGGTDADPGDQLVLAGFDETLDTRTSSINEFVFQDGSTGSLDGLWSDGSDTYLVKQADGSGELVGTALQDELRGGLGAEQLDGGEGNDRLMGGAGNDVYLFGFYSGQDVIFDSAQDPNAVVFTDDSVTVDSLYLSIDNGISTIEFDGNSIVLEGWSGVNPDESPIRDFVFADGSTLSMTELFNLPRDSFGTPGDDVLVGTTGDDWFVGMEGADDMRGGAGSDVYDIEVNSGADVITDASTLGQENTLWFDDSIAPEDVRLSVDAQRHLLLELPGNGNQVTLADVNVDSLEGARTIDFFEFDQTGEVLTYEELLARGFDIQGSAKADILQGSSLHDVIHAGAGDDLLLASAGGDLLAGGAGNDTFEYRLGDGVVQIEDVADATGGNVLRFADGITPALIERKLRFTVDESNPANNRFQIVFDENDRLELIGFDPQNPATGSHAVDYFEFADGTVLSWPDMLDKVFVLEGDQDANTLTGTSRSDRLYGYEVDDLLVGNAGDDVLTGGTGADSLQGGDGADNYVFHLGDGQDSLLDTSADNTLSFGAGITQDSIAVVREGKSFRVAYGTQGDSVLIKSVDGSTEPMGTISNVELADGTRLPFASFLEVPNAAPTLVDDTAQVSTSSVQPVTGNVLANDSDADPGTTLNVVNAGSLTGTYGTLDLATDGDYAYHLNHSDPVIQALKADQHVSDSFTYRASDGQATAEAVLQVTVAGANDAPMVATPIAAQSGREQQAFSFTVAENTFSDVDQGDVLIYSALMLNADGSTQALPGWLHFNATSRSFSGTPGSTDGGSLDIQITATDTSGASVSTKLTLDIADEFAGTGNNLNVITGSWKNDTLNGTRRSETLLGNGGTDKLLAGEGDNTITSNGGDTLITAGAGVDIITSSYGNDTIDAGEGNNRINAGGGNNQVTAGSGNDSITTDWGRSTISAGAGNNTIVATGDSTTVASAGAGDDTITTSYGNDTIDAGDGNNRVNAGGGNNQVTAGSGNDTITTDWGTSTIKAGDGTNTVTATGGNTTVTTGAGADTITTSWGADVIDAGDGNNIICAAGGANTITSGSGNDIITADGSNTIHAGAGNDQITTSWGADTIDAGAGDDTIRAGGGGNTVRGGQGNDTIIIDQWSNDTYQFAAGDGQDSIADAGGQDSLVLENISSNQLWFTHSGNDLQLSVIGTTDSITLKDWYGASHIEQITTSDGKTLLDSKVQNLVSAMAGFAPPPAGQTTLTAANQNTLAPVLAANWQ